MSKNSNKWALGALVAAAAGYVGGILTAPKSGKETRQDIKDSAAKAKAEAEKKLKQAQKELMDLMDKVKAHKSSATSRAKTELDELVKKAQGAKDKASEMLSAAHEGEANDKDLQKAIDEAKKASEHLKKFLSNAQKSK
jgi:gas vesicle protein